jgi:DNA ligase D-like protein (predicted 3'-phosphoesterase)
MTFLPLLSFLCCPSSAVLPLLWSETGFSSAAGGAETSGDLDLAIPAPPRQPRARRNGSDGIQEAADTLGHVDCRPGSCRNAYGLASEALPAAGSALTGSWSMALDWTVTFLGGQPSGTHSHAGGRGSTACGRRYGRRVTASRFVVQLHDATRLHFDFRIQVGEILRSWAVPRGPSLDPAMRRLAVPVEDHSLEAGDFEGVHHGQARGSGAVIIWDEGPAEVLRDEPGHLSFTLQGSKLAGGFALTRTGERRWILVKVGDEHAHVGSDIAAERPDSVRSGKTWQDLARARQQDPA